MSDLGRRTQAIHELTRGQGLALRVLDSFSTPFRPMSGSPRWRGAGASCAPRDRRRSARAVADFTANLRASGAFKDVEIAMSRQDFGKDAPRPAELRGYLPIRPVITWPVR